jgi:DNA processing protein
MELMNWHTTNATKPKQHTLTLDLEPDDLLIVNYIKQKNKIGIDDISFDLHMNQGEVLMRLLQLEFKGIVRSLPGKFFEMI